MTKQRKLLADNADSGGLRRLSAISASSAKSANIAVIGGGYWGKNLVRNFYELSVLKTVCDRNRASLEELQMKYPQILITDSADNIFSDKSIEGVVIATPAVTHYQITKKALLSGKDVFVEKPLALNLKEGKELVDLAKKMDRILMVGHLLLYHPAVIQLKRLIDEGALGKIRYIYSNRLNFGKLRTEENILWSFAPHDIAVIIELFGQMPSEVCSHGMSWLNKDIADVTISYLKFNHHQSAHIFISWLNPFKEQKLAVIGEEKMAVFDDQAENKLVVYPHKVEWFTRPSFGKQKLGGREGKIPEAKKADGQAIPLDSGEPLRLECQHFLDCIKTRQEPKTNGDEALAVLAVLAASQKSLDNNGKAIKLAKQVS